jgi:hypothetical protein
MRFYCLLIIGLGVFGLVSTVAIFGARLPDQYVCLQLRDVSAYRPMHFGLSDLNGNYVPDRRLHVSGCLGRKGRPGRD